MVKNPPAMKKTWVGSLVWEDPLEEAMAIQLEPGEEAVAVLHVVYSSCCADS